MSFQSLLPEYHEAPFFHVVYVGTNSETFAAIQTAAGEISTIDTVAIAQNLSGLQDVCKENGLRIAKVRGCLIVIWDTPELERGVSEFLRSLPNSIQQLQPPLKSISPFAVSIGLSANTNFSFFEFIAAINFGFIGMAADVNEVTTSISRLCHPERQPSEPLSLCTPVHKQPSLWIRKIGHDFFGNAVARNSTLLHEAGMESMLCEAAVLEKAIRNVLVSPFSVDSQQRMLQAQENSRDRRIAKSEVRLICRGNPLADRLTQDFATIDVIVFESEDDLISIIAPEDSTATSTVLLLPVGMEELLERKSEGIATVLVDDENTYTASWNKWNALLERNVLGCFTTEQLVSEGLLKKKVPFWAMLARCTIKNAFATVAKTLETAYNVFGEKIPVTDERSREKSEAVRRNVFRSLGMMHAASGLYFGTSDSTCEDETPSVSCS